MRGTSTLARLLALATVLTVACSLPGSPRRDADRDSAQARQLFGGLWEVVRARGLHQLAPELWAVM
ncbi:MAG: hypothetical protein M3170_07760, partial [Candidatus Dormibacteraeota bacterium]|nr:hypothetical protein [Candidatus Dormibacteraeota bacterium]